MESRTEHLERRLTHLERANRALLLLVGLATLVPLLAGARSSQVADVVQARRIQLVDGAGRIRMELRHDSTETGLFIFDESGDTRLGAAQFAHGGGGYALHGPGGRGAAVMYLKGQGSVTVYDDDGTVTARLAPGGW